MLYAIYRSTGEIVRVLQCPPEMLKVNLGAGEYSLPCEREIGFDTHWVNTVDRLILPKEDYLLDALPLPCTINIEGVDYSVKEQPTLEFDVPGSYVIQVDAGPRYLRKEFVIDYSA